MRHVKKCADGKYYDSQQYWVLRGNEMLGYCEHTDRILENVREPVHRFRDIGSLTGSIIYPEGKTKMENYDDLAIFG